MATAASGAGGLADGEQPHPEQVPLPEDPWEHGVDPWQNPDVHSSGVNASEGVPPGFAHSAADGVFPGGPVGPPMSYAPGFMGGCGPCPGHGGCLPQGPCGCGSPNVHPGPCHLPGSNVCPGPGIPPSHTVPLGPCPLPSYGVCPGGGMGPGCGMVPGCGGFQPAMNGVPYTGCGCGMMMNGWPNAMWNGCGGMPCTGVYGDSQSWSKPTTPTGMPNAKPRPILRGGDLGVEETRQIPRMMTTKVVLPEMRVEAQQRRLHQRSVRC